MKESLKVTERYYLYYKCEFLDARWNTSFTLEFGLN